MVMDVFHSFLQRIAQFLNHRPILLDDIPFLIVYDCRL